MQLTSSRREGFALALAIGAIVVIGALIAGVFFASSQQFRIGRSTLLQTRARAGAEYGLNSLFDTNTANAHTQWRSAWNNSTALGVQSVIPVASTGDVWDTVRVTKLNTLSFLVTSEAGTGTAEASKAHDRLGALVVLKVPKIKIRGAVTLKGDIKTGGSTTISGNDTTVSGWNCPPPDTALPGIDMAPGGKFQCSGCKGDISGNPTMKSNDAAAANDSTYTQFGDLDWASMTAQGKIVSGNPGLPTYNADGSCNTTDPYNWGDPLNPTLACGTYYPILYAPGDLSVTGGIGQGILLVNGNLNISGTFVFYGMVIAKGIVSNTGNGTIYGALMAAGVDQTKVTGSTIVHYSSCVLNRSIRGSAKPILAPRRSWVELY